MSEPQALSISRLNPPESMQLSDCVVTHEIDQASAIDQFEQSLLALVKTSATLGDATHPDVLAEMLIVSAVGSVEAYFRHLFASLVATCPLVAENVGTSTVPYHAVRSYPRHVASLALLEGVMFSTSGVISKEIRRFTRFEVARDSDLAAAIASFEVVCRVRHAAAHWRGFLDSRAVSMLGIQSVQTQNYRLHLSLDLVQQSFAVCDYLVRLVNDTIFRLTIRNWTREGILSLDGDSEDDDVARCEDLLRVFGSSSYCASSNIDGRSLYESQLEPDPT